MAELNTFCSSFLCPPGILRWFVLKYPHNSIWGLPALQPRLWNPTWTPKEAPSAPQPHSAPSPPVPWRSSSDLWRICTHCAQARSAQEMPDTILQSPSGTVTCRSTECTWPKIPPCPYLGITSAWGWHGKSMTGAAPTQAEGKVTSKQAPLALQYWHK